MKTIKMTILLLCIFLLIGCYDMRKLEELAYIVVIGIDKDEDDGKNILVTFQIANPQVGSSFSATAENEDPSEIITLSAPDINTAFDLANITVSRRLTPMHAVVIVISEDLTKSDRMPLLADALVRSTDINRLLNIIVCKEKASDFISNDRPRLETRPHKHYELMSTLWEESGFVPDATLGGFFNSIDSKSAYLAIYGTAQKNENDESVKRSEDKYKAGEVKIESKNPLQIIGSVVLVNGRAISTLNGEETRLVRLLSTTKSETQYWYATFTDPLNKEAIIVARVKRNKGPKIKIDAKEIPKIDINIELDLEIETIEALVQYGMDEELLKQLKESIDKELEDKTISLIKKAQSEIGSDLFNWSLKARRNFLTISEYEQYDWKSKFPNAEVKVKYDIKIKNFSKQIESFRKGKLD